MYHFIFKRHVKPTFISSRRQWSIEENSRPEQSIPLQSATINWQGPKYSIFNMKVSRLKSYTHWPHGHYLCITSRITIFESTQYNLFIGQGGRTICFHCARGLKNWRPTDDAWREHALWFPYRAYIRYIKGEEFIRVCRICVHSCNHTALTCFSETATGRSQASRHLPGTSST